MLTGLVVFLLLLIAILAIPVTLTFDVSWREAIRNDSYLQWAFGLVRVKIPSGKTDDVAQKDELSAQKSGRRKRSRRRKPNVVAAIRLPAFRRRIIRFIRDLWGAVRKEDVVLRVRAGLGDPADTGQLWAMVGPVSGMLTNVRDASINIEPEFFESTLELDGSGRIQLIPLRIIGLAIALLFSPSIWRGFGQM